MHLLAGILKIMSYFTCDSLRVVGSPANSLLLGRMPGPSSGLPLEVTSSGSSRGSPLGDPEGVGVPRAPQLWGQPEGMGLQSGRASP